MQTDVLGGIKSPSFCWDRAGCLRDIMSSLLLLLLLGLRVIESATGKWRPCTDLLPLDILSRVVPAGSSAPLPAVHMIQSGGARGVRFSRPHPSLSFPSSQLLANCDLLPKEFSIVVTLKVNNMAPKKNEYLLSVVEDYNKENKGLKAEQDEEDNVRALLSKGEKDERQMILGLRVSRDRFHYLFKGQGGVTKHLVFRGVRLADNRWHTLVLVVSGQRARLTIDCSTMLEVSSPLLSDLSLQGSRFHVSSRGRRKGLFSGLLRQLVLVPGSDATSKICPSSNPRLTELIVPPLLLDLSIQGIEARVFQPSHEATVRVSVGVECLCSDQLRGQLWFNPFTRGLYLCDGSVWVTMLQEHNRLDYVTEHQVLTTSSETYDVEVFHVPGFGLMAAMAHRSPSSGSAVYLWSPKGFQLYQNISTHGALVWRHFRLGKKLFLVVSNSGGGMEGEKEREAQLSMIYKWSKKRKMFEWFQTLQTHSARDWEAFHINGQAYLVVANHRQGDNNHTIDSVLYRWSPGTRLFEVHQALRTSGAYDWEYFTVGQYHFLVVANAFDGVTTHVDSVIYVWVNGRFQVFQTIKTFCATDWEMFKIGSRVFLVVANGHRLNGNGHSRYAINSTIYELDINEQLFIRFQDIVTYSAVDWEFFALGEENFLVVANSFDGESYSLNSVLYRWQGYEGFVPVHWLPTIGCSDWEFFTSEGNAYLIYSSAKASLAKVFKLKTL